VPLDNSGTLTNTGKNMPYQDDFYPSEAELDRHEAYEKGEANPTCAWICTNRDAWHANPFYVGEEVPHPEMAEGFF